MIDDIKTRLLGNAFIDELRFGWQINREAYEELVHALKQLAKDPAWRSARVWDRELVSDLYTIGFVARNMGVSAAIYGIETHAEIAEMAECLDVLIFECLGAPGQGLPQ